MVAFGTALVNHSAAASTVSAVRTLKLFQPVDKPQIDQLQNQLLATPLEPNLLHGFVARRVSDRRASMLDNAERAALESLGWQSTALQIDLILDGIVRQDEALVLTRIDGLLRRRKQISELVNILAQIEQSGNDARGKLVTMLLAKPSWRRDFLQAPAGTSSDEATLARYLTLNAMFAERLAPTRAEVAPVINKLVAMGQSERAQDLWRQFQRIGRDMPLPFDPTFAAMASNAADGEYNATAYEWRPGEGSGFSVQASLVGDGSAVLSLRWDGRGAPVLLQQKLITSRGRFTVTAAGSLLDRSAMQRLAFVFYCDGSAPVFHDRLSQGTEGEFYFAADEAVGCDDPEMRLVGISDQNATAVELELSSIRVRRQAVGS
jgi:hypothetical protein